jgi:cytochrome P450
VVGQNPWLDRIIVRNPVKRFLEFKELWPSSLNTAIVNFVLDRQREHAAKSTPDTQKQQPHRRSGVNILERFLQSQEKNPEFLTDNRITAMCTSFIIVSSDSTSISLSAVFYFLPMNPRVYRKLIRQIDTADAAGSLASSKESTGAGDVVPFTAANKVPYLHAVINESFRMHPAVGLLLERVTPPGGAKICGEFVPGGTVVGRNAWVIHQSKEVFGLMCRPGRLSKMRQSMFQFGVGSRTCIGRNTSLMETYKIIPTLFRKFEVRCLPPRRNIGMELNKLTTAIAQVELAEPEGNMYLKNAFFVHRKNFMVHIRLRSDN